MKTHLELFLAWCAKRDIKPKHIGGSKWTIARKHLTVMLGGVKIPQQDDPSFYFDQDDGRWVGGTNYLWGHRLPWVKQRAEDFRCRSSGQPTETQRQKTPQ